jgi:hypothetical protein
MRKLIFFSSLALDCDLTAIYARKGHAEFFSDKDWNPTTGIFKLF